MGQCWTLRAALGAGKGGGDLSDQKEPSVSLRSTGTRNRKKRFKLNTPVAGKHYSETPEIEKWRSTRGRHSVANGGGKRQE
jgi:hypothetical protein